MFCCCWSLRVFFLAAKNNGGYPQKIGTFPFFLLKILTEFIRFIFQVCPMIILPKFPSLDAVAVERTILSVLSSLEPIYLAVFGRESSYFWHHIPENSAIWQRQKPASKSQNHQTMAKPCIPSHKPSTQDKGRGEKEGRSSPLLLLLRSYSTGGGTSWLQWEVIRREKEEKFSTKEMTKTSKETFLYA